MSFLKYIKLDKNIIITSQLFQNPLMISLSPYEPLLLYACTQPSSTLNYIFPCIGKIFGEFEHNGS